MAVIENEQWLTCMPVDHALAERNEVRIDELLLDPIICSPESASHWRDYWMALEYRAKARARSSTSARLTMTSNSHS